jgi:hypothetical protein
MKTETLEPLRGEFETGMWQPVMLAKKEVISE